MTFVKCTLNDDRASYINPDNVIRVEDYDAQHLSVYFVDGKNAVIKRAGQQLVSLAPSR